MKRRFFVAIPIPDEIKRELRYVLDWIDDGILSCGRMIPEEDWHITLKFLGEQDEENVPHIVTAIQNTAREYEEVRKDIGIPDVTYDENIPPRMIWANGRKEDSVRLGSVRDAFDAQCVKNGIFRGDERKSFTTHITLVRFFRNPPKDAYVREPIEMFFTPKSIDLMESHLNRSGAEYTLVERITL